MRLISDCNIRLVGADEVLRPDIYRNLLLSALELLRFGYIKPLFWPIPSYYDSKGKGGEGF